MPGKKPDLSVIVISYNTREITGNCIRSIGVSLRNASFQTEIIVIDNASSDDTVAELKKMSNSLPQTVSLHIVANPVNSGFAKANNLGVKVARGNYLLLLNSDTVVLDDSISRLFSFFRKHPEVHFLGPKLFNKDMTPQASSAPFYSLPVIFAALFLKGDYWGLTRNSPAKFTKTGWVSGACILTTKENFEKIGGFDEAIFMYMDEVDLLYRAFHTGLSTFFYPDAQFIHLGSASSNGKTYPILQVYRGLLYFYKKHHTPFELLLLRFMLQLKAMVSIIIGYITNNSYLKQTYAEAYSLARQ